MSTPEDDWFIAPEMDAETRMQAAVTVMWATARLSKRNPGLSDWVFRRYGLRLEEEIAARREQIARERKQAKRAKKAARVRKTIARRERRRAKRQAAP